MENAVRCLLIDNDEDDQDIFCMALQEVDSASSCHFADNGESAMELLNNDLSFIPSLIFIDMNMPLMNGTQCLQEIKKLDRLKQVPVYVYSTAADPGSIAEVKQLGAADFILKPASFQGLTDILSKIIQSHKSSA